MKTGVYPGSFNPWHDGHADVLKKALEVFDHVIVAVGINPDKKVQSSTALLDISEKYKYLYQVSVMPFEGLLVDFVKDVNASAVIRGLRNGQDLEYERTQQYWNEDLGIKVPTVYFVTDRKLVHVSSSALRALEKIKNGR